jgi:hypothetical protein
MRAGGTVSPTQPEIEALPAGFCNNEEGVPAPCFTMEVHAVGGAAVQYYLHGAPWYSDSIPASGTEYRLWYYGGADPGSTHEVGIRYDDGARYGPTVTSSFTLAEQAAAN